MDFPADPDCVSETDNDEGNAAFADAAPACSDGVDNDEDEKVDFPDDPDCSSYLDNDETDAEDAPTGPWERIAYWGSEIGTGNAATSENASADFVRLGVPTSLGWELSSENPLPSGTNAVRFAVGELIVGQEYFAEISMRVLGLPLDTTMDADINCAEVFGGDAAQPQKGQDNAWRYFVPSPACVQLDLVFDLTVDKLSSIAGETITYTLRTKNLSTETKEDVVITNEFDDKVDFVDVLAGTPTPTENAGMLTWPTIDLEPGEEVIYQWEVTVRGNKESTLSKAVYTSPDIPAGFETRALTVVEPLPQISPTATVSTNPATSPVQASASDVVHYVLTLTNDGTGDAGGGGFVRIMLPAGFTMCDASSCGSDVSFEGGTMSAPTPAGTTYEFSPSTLAPGESLTLEFDAEVGAGVSPGTYTISLQSQFASGKDIENQWLNLAPLLVDQEQTLVPTMNDALAGDTTVTGSAPANSTVRVFVNGTQVDEVTADGSGSYSATVPALYTGQRITATAQSSDEAESPRLMPEIVVAGLSDGTGGETMRPACSDGLDNNDDGKVDYPNDPSCSSFLDDSEDGSTECSDGVDNDGDGEIDTDDEDCASGEGSSESSPPACANGQDDDGDGLADYPADPGCESARDNSEVDSKVDTSAGGAGSDSGTTGTDTTGGEIEGMGGVIDLGGVEPGDEVTGDKGGCGCHAVGRVEKPGSSSHIWFLLSGGLLLVLRRLRSRLGSVQRD